MYTPNTNALVDLGKAGVPLEKGISEDIRGIEELRYNPYHDPINGRFTTASGANGRLNAAIHIAKNANKSGHYYKSQSENGIFITDGFRIHKHKSIDGDKVLPKSGRKQKSVNAEILYNGIKSEFTEAEKTGALKEIELPDISSVKNSIMHDFGENAPMLKSKYLEDAMKAVPNAKAYINTSKNGELSAVYLKNDSGDEAFVMPARKRKRPEWVPSISSMAELRYNHNHDPETGRFSSGSGVDKSGKSGIIEGEKEYDGMGTAFLKKLHTEQEYGVRYGESAVFADMDYINSPEFAKKFDGVSDNEAVKKSLVDCSRKAIEHRNGTFREDMYIINANDGTILGKQLESNTDHGINYNESIRAALSKAKADNIPIIAFHNHPFGVPPSADDFNKALDNNYYLGVVTGHNGQVYLYYKPRKSVANPQLLHDDIAYDIDILGVDVDRAYLKYYRLYGLHYEIMKGDDNHD